MVNKTYALLPGFCLVAVLAAYAVTPPTLQGQSEQLWGEPVNGVQLRLALAKDAPTPASGELSMPLPALEAQLRNTGTGVITFSPDGLSEGALEVDGILRSHLIFRQSSSGRWELQPGAVSRVFPVAVRQWPLMQPPVARVVGRHTLRLRSIVTDPDPENRGVLDLSARDASARSLVLTSNQIDVTVQP
jgi:hypothetical protein